MMTLDNNDKQNIWETLNKILIFTSDQILIWGGVILLILQGLSDITYPHALIAGSVCLGAGVICYIIEKIFKLMKLKLKGELLHDKTIN